MARGGSCAGHCSPVSRVLRLELERGTPAPTMPLTAIALLLLGAPLGKGREPDVG